MILHPVFRRVPSAGLGLVMIAALLCASLGLATRALAAGSVSAIGLIDYSSKPNFKLGDWVRYRVEAETNTGDEVTSYQEVSIVGEETYRGEKCFWVETGTGRDTTAMLRTLMLMSYEAFKDPNADVRFKRYMRLMMLAGSLQEGTGGPEMVEVEQPREDAPPTREEIQSLRGQLDTLGLETIRTERGPIDTRAISLYRKLGATDARSDSTIQHITETKRTVWNSRRVPITSQVRFEQRVNSLRKAYELGTVSTDAPENVVSWYQIRSNVVAWGTGATNDFLIAWKKRGGLLKPTVGQN